METLVLFTVKQLVTSLTEDSLSLGSGMELVEDMKEELKRMQYFLVDADKKRSDGDTDVRNLMIEVRELTYYAEEVLATFVVEAAGAGRSRSMSGLSFNRLCSVKTSATHRVIEKQIQQINNRFAELTRKFEDYGVERVSVRVTEPRITYSTMVEEYAVGLQDHIEALVTHLKDGNHYRVITIWGTGGVGKTTLSKMIHRHREIKHFFDHIAFVGVSEHFNPTQVWRDVLLQFADSEEQKKRTRKLTESELVVELDSLQKEKKCLVILDDIWYKKDWNELLPAFPPATATGSKIVVTARNEAVASLDDVKEVLPYELHPLSYEHGLELLEKKAFPEGQGYEMSTEMKKVMESIVPRCVGLPLVISLIGGLLAKDKTFEGWSEVSNSLNLRKVRVQDVLALSYRKLPNNLKACFLYLSLFPEDCEIEVKSLVQMWIAEGFVSSAGTEGGKTMLDVGLTYLDELVKNSMVKANLTRFTKRVRSCRVHDLMRDFCLLKAQEENFYKNLRLGHSIPSTPTSVKSIHRLAVYFNDTQQRRGLAIIPRQVGQHVVSCLVHPPGDHANLSFDTLNSLLKGFRFLKVFNLEHSGSTDHGKLSEDIGKLVHLRYLKLALSSLRLPASLGNLILLQTLDLRGIECVIPNVLWKLKELRHLYLPRYCLHPIKLRLDGLSKLETLVNFHTDFCDIGSLETLLNLRKLGISCRVDELAIIFALPIFSASNSLLRRSTFNIDGAANTQDEHDYLTRVLGYPRLFKLTLNGLVYAETSFLDALNTGITSVTLTGCQLNEDPMPVLGKMPNLRKLTLRRDSYTGEKILCLAPDNSGAGGFPQLTLLWLKGLDISEWEIEEGAMSCLSTLGIYSCKKLKEIPHGLKSITTLESLHFAELKASFQRRILQGGEDFHKVEHVPSIRISY